MHGSSTAFCYSHLLEYFWPSVLCTHSFSSILLRFTLRLPLGCFPPALRCGVSLQHFAVVFPSSSSLSYFPPALRWGVSLGCFAPALRCDVSLWAFLMLMVEVHPFSESYIDLPPAFPFSLSGQTLPTFSNSISFLRSSPGYTISFEPDVQHGQIH